MPLNPSDTSAEDMEMIVKCWRSITALEKFEAVDAATQDVEEMAAASVRLRPPHADDVEIRRDLRRHAGSGRGETIAGQSVGLIWGYAPGQNCLAATTTSNDQGEFPIGLPENLHRQAAWEDGGAYCMVWDLNGDDKFDSIGEPVACQGDVPPRISAGGAIRPQR